MSLVLLSVIPWGAILRHLIIYVFSPNKTFSNKKIYIYQQDFSLSVCLFEKGSQCFLFYHVYHNNM